MEANMKKSIRNFISIMAIVLAFCFALTACGGNTDSTGGSMSESTSSSQNAGKVSITFSCGESLTMNEWETMRVTATASDKSSVTLTADDSSVLYLRGTSVTALKAGTTTITAKTKTGSATAKLKVTVNEKAENRPVLSVIGNGDIALGETSKFSASLSGVDAGDYVVQFSVDNPTVASVDEEGKVTALASGKTKLTASTTYRSVQFKAEKDIIVEKEIKVIFAEGAAEAKLAVSAVKEGLEGEYAVEINGKTYSVDEEGEITLPRADFNVAGQKLFDGKITQGENVYTFRIAVFFMEEPAIYQDGEAITPNENGEYVVDKTKPADENGLRWITFDNAKTMLDMGYELLKIKVKFNAFCSSSAAIVDSTIAAYHYNFGYKYTEYTDDPAAGDFVWLFWDNDYQGKAYGGAMKPAHHAPYGYGYWKIFDASGNLLLDYYQKQIEDASGVHGNWSDYIEPLQTNTEYIFLFDISKTHDISFSGFDDAVITGFEWAKKEETVVSFENESISVDEWIETEVNATTNDGSAVEYTVSDPEVLYVSGNKIVGLKAGSAKVIATANGKKAELNVTVNEQAANRPAVEFEGLEIEQLGSGNLGATLKVGGNTVAAGKYTLEYTAAENDVISIVGSVVAGLKVGEADVTAKITYCGKEFTKTVKVTVKKAEEPVDPSIGKLYQGGEELTPDENGYYVMDTSKEGNTFTFDPFATKSALGYKKIRFTVKFSEITNNNITLPGAGGFSFGYTYGSVSVGWYNCYVNGDGKEEGAYVGAFANLPDGTPNGKAYLRVYNAKGEKIFEHYDVDGWSSSHYGYIPKLEADTEYTFEIDTEITGDVTLLGFNKATFTAIKWVNFDKTEVTFDKESVEADEWTEFGFSAVSNDGSDIELTSDNEEVLLVKGNKAIGIKAGTANIVATANGVTVKLPVTIKGNAVNRPVVEAGNVELSELETVAINAAFKVGGAALSENAYTIAYASEDAEIIAVAGKEITALKAGEATVTVTVTFWGKTFTADVAVKVNAAEKPVDPSAGKLFQGGEEVAAAEDGSVTPDATNADKTLKFDAYAVKSALGMRRIRFTVKFKAFSANVVQSGFEFGYRYNSINVLFDNDYAAGMYAGALAADGSPTEYGYVRIYDNTGALYFEHYNCPNWSSSGFGYVSALALDTEYTFDIDTEKTGDITLYGFENAVFTKIEWVDYNKTEITFNKENVEADEWTEFDFSATTNDLSILTFTSDDEGILVVKGNKAIGVSAGTTNIVAKNSAGKTALLPVTITENAAKRPVLTAVPEKTSVEVLDGAVINAQLKTGETIVSASEYTLNAVSDSEAVKIENGKVIGVSEGQAKVTVTATYYGKEFTAQFDITVVAAEDPTKGKLFQNGKEIVANEAGEYKVDTTVAGDANGLHWLTVDTAKTVSYDYLRFTVTFDSFPSYKKMTPSQYDYNFGYNYGSVTAFWDNIYPSGGFGGALGTDGGANGIYYWNVYTAADNNKILDLMSATNWSPYKTLETGVEYIFEFNVKAMGESFTLAGFETATIKNITWAEALLG